MGFAKKQNSLVPSPRSGTRCGEHSGSSQFGGNLCTMSFELCYSDLRLSVTLVHTKM